MRALYLNVKLSMVGPGLSGASSVLTTLSSDRAELETTGLRDTTQRELSLSIPSLTWSGKRQSLATAYKGSR